MKYEMEIVDKFFHPLGLLRVVLMNRYLLTKLTKDSYESSSDSGWVERWLIIINT